MTKKTQIDELLKPCPGQGCTKTISKYVNRCWDCMICDAIVAGGKFYCPNGLPVASIHSNGNMYEHSHGDHPDYKFPIEIEFVGVINLNHFEDYANDVGYDVTKVTLETFNEEEVRNSLGETHALIYTDGIIALTLYETSYGMWFLHDGRPKDGQGYWQRSEWKISERSLEKIRNLKK